MKEQPEVANPAVVTDEPLLLLDEAAAYLRVHPQTLRGLARRRKVPARRIGAGWRFLRSELDRYMADQAQKES